MIAGRVWHLLAAVHALAHPGSQGKASLAMPTATRVYSTTSSFVPFIAVCHNNVDSTSSTEPGTALKQQQQQTALQHTHSNPINNADSIIMILHEERAHAQRGQVPQAHYGT
jgi:hypothetical protein